MQIASTRYWNIVLIIFGLVLVTLLRSGDALNYTHWKIDEHFIIPFSVGFLGGDLNPKWFGYGTFPMYVLSALYFIILQVYLALGLVASKLEFASLIFKDDAVFYVSARLLFSLAHTIGIYVLAYIIYYRYRSLFGAIVFFCGAILIPDSVIAANWTRVDSFLFLFLCLTIYFSCFAEKGKISFFISILACSAAIASKLPALTMLPVLFLKISYDVFRGHYPKRYLFYAIALPPLLVICFMPYIVLDFDRYKLFLASGGTQGIKVAAIFSADLLDNLQSIYNLIVENTGLLSVIGFVVAILWGALKDRRLFFVMLFALGFIVAFSTSTLVRGYWLRPIYPLFLFATVVIGVGLTSWLGRAVWINRFTVNEQGRLRHASALKYIPLILLAGYYTFTLENSAYSYYQGLTDQREDTRVLASDWIQENIPANSTVALDVFLGNYLPNVFSSNVATTVILIGYEPILRIGRNTFLIEALQMYMHNSEVRAKNKPLQVSLIFAKSQGFHRVAIPTPSFIVTTSSNYKRFYTQRALINPPQQTRRAREFYDYIHSQELVKRFSGRGPDISIYRFAEAPPGGQLQVE